MKGWEDSIGRPHEETAIQLIDENGGGPGSPAPRSGITGAGPKLVHNASD
jgi:hypothetical protein